MLKRLKLLLGFADDNSRDALLTLIIEQATARLLWLLGGIDEVPEQLEYIVIETAVARFNRIGSEGLTSQIVEDEHLEFVNDDFALYSKEIQGYIKKHSGDNSGVMRFL